MVQGVASTSLDGHDMWPVMIRDTYEAFSTLSEIHIVISLLELAIDFGVSTRYLIAATMVNCYE